MAVIFILNNSLEKINWRKKQAMIVCDSCLNAIESHEGNQLSRKLDLSSDIDIIVYGNYKKGSFIKDKSGEEHVCCEWCKEYVLFDEACEI